MNFIEFNYASLILILTVFQGGFLTLFLLSWKHRSRLSSRLLAALTLNFTLHFANVLLTEFGPLSQRFNFNPVFILCYGPILLLFIRSIIRPHFTMRGSFRHFVPAIAAFFIVAGAGLYAPWLWGYLPVPLMIQLTAYLLVAKRTMRTFRRTLQDQFADIEEIDLDWLRQLINQTLLLLVLAIAHFIVQVAGFAALQNAFTLLIFLAAFYFINTLVLKGMSHPSIDNWLASVAPGRETGGAFADPPGSDTQPPASSEPDPTEGERYRGSGLSPEESRACYDDLLDLMARDEPYLDEKLNIHQLAETLGISSKHLSQVINQNGGQNFYDFINSYRIEKAKQMLLDPARPDLRVSEVMYDVGFSAKSTFNSLFKSYTGLTPTQFRRQNRPRS